jgi:hypothetical protein
MKARSDNECRWSTGEEKSGLLLILFMLLLSLTVSQSFAATYYLSPSGSWTTGTGTSGSPWGRLQDANTYSSKFAAGDILMLMDGYHGIVNWSNLNKGGYVSLVAQHTNMASVSYICLSACGYISFTGIHVYPWASGSYVRNDSDWPYAGLVDVNGSGHIYFDNVLAEAVTSPWQTAQAWIDSCYFSTLLAGYGNTNADSITVVNSVFRGGRYNVLLAAADRVLLQNMVSEWFAEDGVRVGNQATVRFCTIRDAYTPNTDYHSDLMQIMGNGASIIVSDILIENNLMYAASPGRTDPLLPEIQGIFTDQGIRNFTIRNNVLVPRHSGIGIGIYNGRQGVIVNNTVAIRDTMTTGTMGYISVSDRTDQYTGAQKYSDSLYVANNISINYEQSSHPSIVFENNFRHGVTDTYSHNYANQWRVFRDLNSNDVYPKDDSVSIVNKITTNDSRVPSIDLAGVTRSSYGLLDYGAFEYAGPGGGTIQITTPPVVEPPSVEPPVIASVTIAPNTGTAKIGDSIVITVTAQNNQTGLTASNATINGKQVAITSQGNGIYRGTYTVAAGDNNGVNVETSGIILSNSAGTTPAASSTGSSLRIDAQRPAVVSVALAPNTGTLSAGSTVVITATAANNETGLVPSNALFLGKQVPLTAQGGGVYRGSYTVLSTDKGGNSEFADDAFFKNNLETANRADWNSMSAGVIYSSEARYGTNGLEYSVSSTSPVEVTKNLPGSYSESYTSYYFKLDPAFSMPNGNTMYIGLVSGSGNMAWSTRIRRSNNQYQVVMTLGAYVTDVGQWTAITPGQWYWIKVHHKSATNGIARWWLNGELRGSFSGDTSNAAISKFNAVYLSNIPAGTTGKLYWDHFQMSPSDHAEPGAGLIEATGITLTDAAGNVSTPAASSGSSLTISEVQIPATPPSIASVTLTPATGNRKVGSTVTITVTAQGNIAGLTASAAQFNGKQIVLVDQANGKYIGVYTVAEGDADASNINATGITLTGSGGTSTAASSSGSTLVIDAHIPSIASVVISPSSGSVTTSGQVVITARAANNESGLFASNATINGKSIPLTGQGDGTYKGTYTVTSTDATGLNIEATGIRLTDAAGNVSQAASSSGSTLSVVIQPPVSAPTIQSVVLTPSTGRLKIGDTLKITVTAGNNQTGLTASKATFNTKQVPLTGQGDGTYVGYYSVIEGDPDASNVNATGITLTSTGGTSAAASSTGSTLIIDANRPVIQSVTISPNTGYISTGATVVITVNAANGESGLTASNAKINGELIALTGQGSGVYRGTYRVEANDNQGVNIMATDIVLTDAAGNASVAGASTGSTLTVDTRAPVIQSVFINPSSGTVQIGNSVSITVTALGYETGLTASNATINGKTVALSEQGGGIYRGTYIIASGDPQGTNIEAVGITLTDRANNVSAPVSSSGSTLVVSTTVVTPPPSEPGVTIPKVRSVKLTPSKSGKLKVNDQVMIEVTAESNTSGLTVSRALINETSVLLTDAGNGVYTGIYTVKEGDLDGVGIEATNITLTNNAGTSTPAASSGSGVSVDGHSPKISLVNITPHTGWVKTGDTVTITVKTVNGESGLIPSRAAINGRLVTISDIGGGNYSGQYVVGTNDIQGQNIEATGITLTDAAGNVSEEYSSTGSTLCVDTIAPVVESVALTPNSGTVSVGDEVFVIVTIVGRETDLIPLSAEINGRAVQLMGMGDGSYHGTYVVAQADLEGQNIEATNIVFRDPAGNQSSYAASFGSTLTVNIETPATSVKPEIASVTISPSSGAVKVGDTVTITVVEAHGLTGLTPSEVTFNNMQLPLQDKGSGRYEATYIVREGDFDDMDVEAKNITLTGTGGTTVLSSSSGSTLDVDAHPPVIHSVELIPTEVTVGQSVVILVTAESHEPGLVVSSAMVNGTAVALRDQGDGTYRGLYTIQATDVQVRTIAVSGITLTDGAGNVSELGPVAYLRVITEETQGAPSSDTTAPQISSVVISPNSGWIRAGQTVNISVTARNLETGLIASNAFINNEFIPLMEKGNGIYTGTYLVREGDSQGRNVEAMGVTLTDKAGNVSQSAASFGSTLHVDTIDPAIDKVELSSPVGKILGVLGIGQTVSIIVNSRDRESGLKASNAQINGKSIPLSDEGNGTYQGTYTIGTDDQIGDNIEATGIVLTDTAGNVSQPGFSTGSGLSVHKSQAVQTEATDFDNDGVVSFTDFTLFVLMYGKKQGDQGWDRKYDLNNNGDINLDDFFVFVENYGKRTAKVAKAAVLASVQPSSAIKMGLQVTVDETAGMSYAKISVSKPADIKGFEFSIEYDDQALTYDENSVTGLTGMSIPIFSPGSIQIASVFPNEKFNGTVTLGFKYIDPKRASGISLTGGMLIESDGVAKIPEMNIGSGSEEKAGFIYDLAVVKQSENFVTVSWTVPAGADTINSSVPYLVEYSQKSPDAQGWESADVKTITVNTLPVGASATANILGLKPGMPYFFAIRPVNKGVPGTRSNIVTAQTMVRFYDEDLDPEDPYIIRDADSLFIADNDRSVTFEWTSWAGLNAGSYRITITANGQELPNPIIMAVQDTTYVYTSEPGATVSISVKPLNTGGNVLADLKSRSILCAPGMLDKPGKPNMVVPE